MIKRVIRNIRRKSRATRDSIALGMAVVFTLVVFGVWIYHVPIRFVALSNKITEDESPNFSQLFGDVRKQAASVKDALVKDDPIASDAVVPQPEVGPTLTSATLESNLSSSSTVEFTTVSSTATSTMTAETINASRPIRIVTISATSSDSAE